MPLISNCLWHFIQNKFQPEQFPACISSSIIQNIVRKDTKQC
jgi:hypothetical protein